MALNEKKAVSYQNDDELNKHFISWTADAIAELKEIIEVLDDRIEFNDAIIKRIYELAHNIKGTGSSFDFDLLTEVGVILCSYLKTEPEDGFFSKRVISSNVRTFEVVLENNIHGDGGRQGAAILQRLQAIILDETPNTIDVAE